MVQRMRTIYPTHQVEAWVKNYTEVLSSHKSKKKQQKKTTKKKVSTRSGYE